MLNKHKIGLGTVQFGMPYGISNKKGQTSLKEVTAILKLASDLGINLLDSASGYGNAEEILGMNDLQNFNLVSKFLPPSGSKTIRNQLIQSLSNLNVSKLYGYLAHRPLELLNSLKQWEELISFKEEGLVHKIGFSFNEPVELEKLLDKGLIPDIIQVPYNYFDRRFESSMITLKLDGCEIHTRSTFLQGLFFVEPEELNIHFNEVQNLIKDLQNNHSDLANQLLNFVINQNYVDKVIIGVENSFQLSENLRRIKGDCQLPELSLRISDNILIPSRWPKN